MQFRNKCGEFASSLWSSLSRNQKQMLFLMVVVILFPIGNFVHVNAKKFLTVKELVAINKVLADEIPVVKDKTARELRDEMMDRLHKGEGAGHAVKMGDIFLTFDPPASLRERCSQIGGVTPMECFSFGEYQMKVSFIQHYHQEIYGKGISEEDAIMLANDAVEARAFAEECIVKVEGCVWKWSYAKLVEPEYFEVVVPIIRKLEQ